MEQKAQELYEDHEDGWCSSQTTISTDERVFMVLKHTKTGNVLETGFKGSFRIRGHRADKQWWTNYNKYVQYGLSLNRNVDNSRRPRTAWTQANIDMVRRTLEAHPSKT